jgi:hypothetical protein
MSKMIHPTTVEMVYVDNDDLVSDQPCICASLCLSTISEGAQTLLMYKIDLECSLKLLRASTRSTLMLIYLWRWVFY